MPKARDTAILSTRVSDTFAAAVRAEALALGVSSSDFVRLAVEALIRDLGQPKR